MDNTKNKEQDFFTPCSPGDPSAIEKTWMDVGSTELLEPELTITDFVKALQQSKKSVNGDDLARYEKWTEEFGQEG